jgi:hypothetical protein
MRSWRQVLTATWAVKTACVWDLISPKDRTVPGRDLKILHQVMRPTTQQQVWVVRYSGDDPHTFRRTAAHVIGSTDADPQNAHAYLVALSVGQLALVVFGQHVVMPPYSHGLPAEFSSKLVQISPTIHETVRWPPPDDLDNQSLESCVRSLGAPIPHP